MKSQNFSEEEFWSLTQSIADTAINAAIHYRLYRDLVESVEAYPREMNEARAFWTLTFISHRDTAITQLCRVYDSEDRSVSLPHWLKFIGQNAQMFEEASFRRRLAENRFVDELASKPRIPDATQLASDAKFVSMSNPLVQRLIILRNNVFAHQSVAHALNGREFLRQYELEATDMWALIDGAREIVNRYSSLFIANIFSDRMVGHEDYTGVLEALRRDAIVRAKERAKEWKDLGWTDIPDDLTDEDR